MARIRTVKPEFFRHEGLQDLERAHKGKNAMLVFIGLWGHCDKGGKFEWRPRQLKLDILPFLDFDMETTLNLLHSAGFLERYEVAGKAYGRIPTFKDHQRVGGKEAQEPDRFPDASPGSISEAPVKQVPAQEGKGREREGNGVPARKRATPLPEGFGISDRVRAWAAERGYSRLPERLEHFLSYVRRKAPTYADWDEALMTAIREDWAKFGKPSPTTPSTRTPTCCHCTSPAVGKHAGASYCGAHMPVGVNPVSSNLRAA